VPRGPRIPLPTLDSLEAETLGLVEGQALMLIDLDRCTRCDQCVEGCIKAHGDGRSRLYLDGPRFGRFLVPATCRSCLDPVCASRCPVSAIWKGDYNQVVITDWCIGCGACSESCPYGAIQMHGIAWRFMPEAQVVNRGWYLSDETDRDWPAGESPFRFDRDFRFALEKQEYQAGPASVGLEPVCFRYRFPESRYALDLKSRYRLEVSTPDPQLALWLNDQLIFKEGRGVADGPGASRIQVEVREPNQPRSNHRKYQLAIPGSRLRKVGNLIALKVRPSGDGNQSFLEVKWEVADEDKPEPEYEPKKVYQLAAVVCDLCSSLPGGPACVSQCPHDAAIRIDVPNEIIPGRAGL
jgi:Fe-S-cluster-containing hydrogenase component 2